uniref:Uncharacterized protein n=1 Tax=Trichobilharzia regenti TaxID=157069 RepID=A0AA85IX14_TRIRE|nr:unnamed protein product [Trichobilharzia regenti]
MLSRQINTNMSTQCRRLSSTLQFRLNLMKSVDENNSGIYESDQENQCDNASTCKCTCHDSHQKLPHKQIWNWEQLDCRKVYIPPFYLTSEYHSDTYLHIQSKCYNGQSVPPNTPHKSMMMMMRKQGEFIKATDSILWIYPPQKIL